MQCKVAVEHFRASMAVGDRRAAVEMIQRIEGAEGRSDNWARMVQDLEAS